MSAGHGRGFYGSEQLQRPRRSRGPGWGTVAVVAGVGAIVWLMWPRKIPEYVDVAAPEASPPSQPTQDEVMEHAARSRGFASTKLYEDAVVAHARELRATGAKVDLAPDLAHLASRVEA